MNRADFLSAAHYADRADEARRWESEARNAGRLDVADIYADMVQDFAHLERRALAGTLNAPAPGVLS